MIHHANDTGIRVVGETGALEHAWRERDEALAQAAVARAEVRALTERVTFLSEQLAWARIYQADVEVEAAMLRVRVTTLQREVVALAAERKPLPSRPRVGTGA